MDALIEQYTGADEDSRLTRQYIAQIEFDTTMAKLKPYLKPGCYVTELGAATGRYSLTFANMGLTTTAVELVPDQVRILKEKAAQQNLDLAIYQGDACDVPFIDAHSQDVCVVLGPLYHLQSQELREQAIAEARRILKPGGIVAVAYISRFFIAGMFTQKFPELVTPDVYSKLLNEGVVTSSAADRFFQVGYFATPKEMEELVEGQGFKLVSHIATDTFSRYIADGINPMTPEQYQAWFEYHLQTCDEPTLLGSSNHGLVIAQC